MATALVTNQSTSPASPTRVRSASTSARWEHLLADKLTSLEPGRRQANEVEAVMFDAVMLDIPFPSMEVIAMGSVSRQLTASSRQRQVTVDWRAETELADALNQAQSKYAEALRQVGMAPEAVELIQSWVDVTATTRVAMQGLHVQRALEAQLLRQDPTEALSAAELGQALGGLSDETVRLRERDGELFSILRPGRKRGREYPVFQTWDGVRGEPLKTVLEALGKPAGAAAYGFFTSASEGIGGLTPIEALTGLSHSADLGDDARAFLAEEDQVRLAAVVEAAKDHAAALLS